MPFNIKNILTFWIIPFILWGFWQIRYSIIAILVGIFLGLAIQTFSFYLKHKLKTNYYLNVILIYLGFITIIGLFFYLFISTILDQFPSLVQKLQFYFKNFNFQKFQLLERIKDFSIDSNYVNNFYKLIINVLGGFFSLVLVFVASIYTSFNKELFSPLFELFPKERREFYEKIWRHIKRKISFWFVGEIVLMIFIGVFTYLFFGPIMKIEYAPIIGFTAGLLEIVPIIGPITAFIFAVFITILEKPDIIFFVIIYFIVLQQIENHFLVPVVMKKAISLNPLLIILGILIGSKIGGFLGIIVILPILGILVEIFHIKISFKEKTLF